MAGSQAGILGVVDLARLRSRMPLVAFILLAVVCLALIGFACACLSDQSVQALERSTSLGGALPALIEVWALSVVLVVSSGVLLVPTGSTFGRASPQLTQRFLF